MLSLNLHWIFPILRGMGLGLGAMALHETAHIATAYALGIEVKKVGFGWKGLYTVRAPGTPGKNLFVSLAGPLLNLVLILTWVWWPIFGLANLCTGVVNLLPIEGSDGQRVLRCWLLMRARSVPA